MGQYIKSVFDLPSSVSSTNLIGLEFFLNKFALFSAGSLVYRYDSRLGAHRFYFFHAVLPDQFYLGTLNTFGEGSIWKRMKLFDNSNDTFASNIFHKLFKFPLKIISVIIISLDHKLLITYASKGSDHFGSR
jgi:hypothetical protein